MVRDYYTVIFMYFQLWHIDLSMGGCNKKAVPVSGPLVVYLYIGVYLRCMRLYVSAAVFMAASFRGVSRGSCGALCGGGCHGWRLLLCIRGGVSSCRRRGFRLDLLHLFFQDVQGGAFKAFSGRFCAASE